MNKYGRLTAKQVAVLDDIFEGSQSEAEILKKHKITSYKFRKWCEQEAFKNEFDLRLESALRQSKILIAKYAPLAAAKLVELTNSDKGETARRACLDIMSLPSREENEPGKENTDKPGKLAVSQSKVSKLLAVLAENE